MPNAEHGSAIERVETLTSDEFLRRYIKTMTPVIITDLVTRWPAMQRWSFEFLAERGTAEFTAERGNVLQGATKTEVVDFQAYVRNLAAGVESDDDPDGPLYLSQSDLFDEFPELVADTDFGIFTDHKYEHEMLGWIGPRGTVTGFHYDRADGMLAQIVGTKRVQLVSPGQSELMYPSPKFDNGSVLSSIDAGDYDEKRFPLFAQARILTTELRPGEVLYTPGGWWHHVESLSASISVNAFGWTRKGVVFDQYPDKLRSLLHRYRLYGKECTCHDAPRAA